MKVEPGSVPEARQFHSNTSRVDFDSTEPPDYPLGKPKRVWEKEAREIDSPATPSKPLHRPGLTEGRDGKWSYIPPEGASKCQP